MKYTQKVLLSILILYTPYAWPIFETLEQITAYAHAVPENPKPDNDDLLDPEFVETFKQQTPTMWQTALHTVLHALALVPDKVWDFEQCITLMKKVTQERVQLGYTKNHVIKLPTARTQKCIIWGDLQGAFHSLVRDLQFLFEQGYIDNTLHITQPDTFFIMTGDTIDSSAYSLATLTVLMKLIEQNPKQAFYIQGNHETKGVWPSYALAKELRFRSQTTQLEEIPFLPEVNAFFNTLPLAVYIESQNTDHSQTFIRVSHYNRLQMPKLDSIYFAPFLRKKSADVSIFYLKNRSHTRDYVDIRAIIEAQNRSSVYQHSDGLQLLESDLGATAWTQLSAPTYVYQKLYNFYYDAFTILDTHEYIDQATITLHKQDIRTRKGFQKTCFNLLTGRLQPHAPPPLMQRINQDTSTPDKGNEIVIGMLTDFSNTSAVTGRLLREGVSVKFNQMNQEHGGVHGKRLRLVMLNDRYTPYITFEKAQSLLNDYKTNILLTPQGTPTLEACLPLIKEHKLLALFNWGGAQIFRNAKLTDCINYRTSYYNEARALVDYAINNLYIKNFTFFYQDDSFGTAPLHGARATLKKHGITKWTEVPYRRNALDLKSSVIKKVEDSHPEALVFFSANTPSAALVRALGTPYLVNKYLFGITFLSDAFKYFLAEKGLPFIISRVVPNPQTSTLQIAQEYRAHLKRYAPDSTPSVDSFEAYINACLLIDVMEKIDGEITKDKIIAAFENMHHYEFKGLTLNFDPKTRELATDTIVWVDTGHEWLDIIKKSSTSETYDGGPDQAIDEKKHPQ